MACPGSNYRFFSCCKGVSELWSDAFIICVVHRCLLSSCNRAVVIQPYLDVDGLFRTALPACSIQTIVVLRLLQYVFRLGLALALYDSLTVFALAVWLGERRLLPKLLLCCVRQSFTLVLKVANHTGDCARRQTTEAVSAHRMHPLGCSDVLYRYCVLNLFQVAFRQLSEPSKTCSPST